MFFKIAISTIGAIFSFHIFANPILNQELISCQEQGGIQRECTVSGGILLAKQAYESDFYVSYSLTCDRRYPGPRPSTIAVSLSDSGQVALNYKDSKKDLYVGRGYGPLTLADNFPIQLKSRSYSLGCSLQFKSIAVKISPEVGSRWEAERNSKTRLLDEKRKLLSSYEYVSVLKPGFDLVKVVADLILTDLNVSGDLSIYLRKFQTCGTDEPEADDCALFLRIIGDNTDRLSFSEKMFLSKLNSTLFLIDPEIPESIDDYLDESDLKLLDSIANKSTEFADLDNKIETLAKEIASLEAQIEQLNNQIGSQ